MLADVDSRKVIPMTKKRLYFVQANDIYGTEKPSVYFPYAVGCLQAYLCQFDQITNEYEFGRIVYTKEPVKQAVKSLSDPFMVLFSCSVWNMEYNKAFARELKNVFPECRITFGGHSVSAGGDEISSLGYVDFVIHGYGEEPLYGLLSAIKNGIEPSNVANISFLSNGEVVTTAKEDQTAADYPSPYLTGVFDEIMQDNISFSALFETNRGCPNNCAFCDWSTLKSKVRLFPMERVKREIDWFADNKIEYIYCTDANFCLFQRDEEIVNYVIESKERFGYPQVFKVNFTKNKLDFVFEIGRRFHQFGLDKAQTISFQSLNPQTLSNIGRKNMSSEKFRQLMQKYRENGIPTYCELILGLPGETYESFTKGVSSLIRDGQHFALFIYPCELLPHAQMGQPWYKEKFGVKSVWIPFFLQHTSMSRNKKAICEMTEIVVGTYSLSTDDWVRCMIFSYAVQAFHNMGLLRQTAIYCANELNVDYDVFYKVIIEEGGNPENEVLYDVMSKLNALLWEVSRGNKPLVMTCEGLADMLWSFDEGLYLMIYKNLPGFYKEIEHIILKRFNSGPITGELVGYQFSVVKKLAVERTDLQAEYDFYSYFNSIYMNVYKPLEKKSLKLVIDDTLPIYSLSDFAREILWYGRNQNKMDYTGGYYPVSVKE